MFKYFEDSWTQDQIPLITKDVENYNDTLLRLDTLLLLNLTKALPLLHSKTSLLAQGCGEGKYSIY